MNVIRSKIKKLKVRNNSNIIGETVGHIGSYYKDMFFPSFLMGVATGSGIAAYEFVYGDENKTTKENVIFTGQCVLGFTLATLGIYAVIPFSPIGFLLITL